MRTQDPFKRIQKTYCVSGAPNKVGMWGCGCCRKIADLNEFRKFIRGQAKAKIRQETHHLVNHEVWE